MSVVSNCREKAGKRRRLAQEASQVAQKPRPRESANSRLPAGIGAGGRRGKGRGAVRSGSALASAVPSSATALSSVATGGRSAPAHSTASLFLGLPPPGPLTVEALHLWLLALRLLLKPLGLAALLAVEHEAQHGNDVGHGGAHRQPNSLDHLVRRRAAQALRLLQHRLV